MTAAAALSRFVVAARPPDGLAAIAVPAVADCFGGILAGADSEVARRVRAALLPLGAGNAAVFGTRHALPAPYAAMVNAVAGHARELDDWEELGNTHPTVVLLPALLAAAHLRPAGGADLLAAYAVGVEIVMRLGEAVTLDHYARGYHATATLGALGAAGAVARLLRLDEGQCAHALALAVSQAVGYTVQFGSNAKPLQAGFAARAGLEAALLAGAGATAQPGAIDDPRGFAGLMGRHSGERLARMAERLGAPWGLEQHGIVLKPWPSCGYTHRLMTAALDLRPRLAGRIDEIAQVRAVLPDFHRAIAPFDRPATSDEALFSIPACIAQALTAGGLTLADCEAGFWRRPEIDRLIGLTEVTAEPARNPDRNYDPDQPDRLQIALQTGEVLEAACAYPLGAPQNPMPPGGVAAKFAAMTRHEPAAFHWLLGWPGAPDAARFFAECAR